MSDPESNPSSEFEPTHAEKAALAAARAAKEAEKEAKRIEKSRTAAKLRREKMVAPILMALSVMAGLLVMLIWGR